MLVDRDSFMNEPTLAKLTFPELRCRSQLGAKSLAASRSHDEFGHTSHDLTKHGAITRETLREEHAYSAKSIVAPKSVVRERHVARELRVVVVVLRRTAGELYNDHRRQPVGCPARRRRYEMPVRAVARRMSRLFDGR
jgi:hypothetical protein